MKRLWLLFLTGCVTTPSNFNKRLERVEAQLKEIQMECTFLKYSPCEDTK